MVGAALTAAVAALLLAFGPAPGDAAAHLYRTFLVRHGVLVWDSFWFAGHYPLASYSLLYYFPAAVVGNLPLVFAAAVASTLLFAAVAFEEWGPAALWPTRVFGVLAAAPVFTGLYSYTLGFATLLGALRAVQRNRVWLAVVLAAVTLGFSPLAFLFLVLILASVFVTRRKIARRTLVLAVSLVVLGCFQLRRAEGLPDPGRLPLSRRRPGSRPRRLHPRHVAGTAGAERRRRSSPSSCSGESGACSPMRFRPRSGTTGRGCAHSSSP